MSLHSFFGKGQMARGASSSEAKPASVASPAVAEAKATKVGTGRQAKPKDVVTKVPKVPKEPTVAGKRKVVELQQDGGIQADNKGKGRGRGRGRGRASVVEAAVDASDTQEQPEHSDKPEQPKQPEQLEQPEVIEACTEVLGTGAKCTQIVPTGVTNIVANEPPQIVGDSAQSGESLLHNPSSKGDDSDNYDRTVRRYGMSNDKQVDDAQTGGDTVGGEQADGDPGDGGYSGYTFGGMGSVCDAMGDLPSMMPSQDYAQDDVEVGCVLDFDGTGAVSVCEGEMYVPRHRNHKICEV